MIKQETIDQLKDELEKALNGHQKGAYAAKYGDRIIKKVTQAVRIEQKRFDVVYGRGEVMDRFKFRGWDKPSDIFPDGCMSYYDIRQQIGDVDIIMQCTGLKDVNGKLIYEGDILRSTCNDSILKITHEELGFYWEDIKDLEEQGYIAIDYLDLKWAEIVGNIHQNKDLLND